MSGSDEYGCRGGPTSPGLTFSDAPKRAHPHARSPRDAQGDLETAAARFHIEVEATKGRHLVHLFGELDLSYSPALQRALVAVGGSEVVADLSGLTFCDASGLRAFLNARNELAGLGHELIIRGTYGIVRKLFAIAELDWLLEEGRVSPRGWRIGTATTDVRVDVQPATRAGDTDATWADSTL